MEVLLDNTFVGIHQKYRDMGISNRLQGFDDRKFLHRLAHIFTTPHPGSIDERIGLPAPLIVDVDTVTGRSRLVENNHPVLAKQSIDEG